MYERIPEELKLNKNWCLYRLVQGPEDKKPRKIPINAYTGNPAKSNDNSTWADYETALHAVDKFNCHGVGYFFEPPYFGVDIDDIADAIEQYRDGETDNIVSEFIHSLESYAELSVSGTGIHIICKGELPAGGRRKDNVEMYQSGRYFIMTGNACSPYEEIAEATAAIKPLHAKYIEQDSAAPSLTVDEIIERAMASKRGDAFRMLYGGGWEGLYSSQSDADMAFCNMLAFWCAGDMATMDSVFRRSGLMRDKWDRKTGATTYGVMTLSKAIRDCKSFYDPQASTGEYRIHVLDQEQTPRELLSFDDTGNGARFEREYRDVARYSYVNKCWYYYNGRKWVYDNIGNIVKMADSVIGKMRAEYALVVDEEQEKALSKHIKSTRSNKGKTNMLREAQHLLPVLPGEFDAHREYFNCHNGFIDLRDGSLKGHRADLFFAKESRVDYTDKIDCPQWMRFLDQIFDGNAELIRYIQKAIGYSLTGSTAEQCMFILHGNGRNGKSVFLDLINEIMGDYACNIQPQSIMVKGAFGGNQANSDIARLQGARFVTTTEPNEGMRFDEGLIKQLTGGDKITARFLYANEFEFTPEFKIWIASNHKPIVRGRDDGIWRRMILIPFGVQIPEDKVDKYLKYKLRRELPGILHWAVQGALMWQREGLKAPAIIADATKEYRSEMDVVATFIAECLEVTGRSYDEIRSKQLYQIYKAWAEDNEQYVMSSTKFGREFGGKFPKKQNQHGQIVYTGIKAPGVNSFTVDY